MEEIWENFTFLKFHKKYILCKIKKVFCFHYLHYHKDQLEIVFWVKKLRYWNALGTEPYV